ncbi:unnamed protein product [Symbiodinium sp. CCMP2456]|nr:unnamed protein product [Symbiodinium sp. CCMP2456]
MLRVWLLPIAAIAAEVGPVAPPPPLEVSDKTSEDETLPLARRQFLREVRCWQRMIISVPSLESSAAGVGPKGLGMTCQGGAVVAASTGILADLSWPRPSKIPTKVLTFAWAAAEYQFPVIEGLMARNDSSGEVVAKAGCSANYAQLLGDITKVFSDLSNSKIYCFESLTNKTAQRECAQNSIKSLEKVTAAIAEAANAMWQCFGIFWGCSQLMNSAYNKLSQAYYASFKMSSKCSVDKDATCDEDFYAFKALGALSAAKGLLQSAQQECDIKGGTLEHPLNPWAATPFMPRKAWEKLVAAGSSKQLGWLDAVPARTPNRRSDRG